MERRTRKSLAGPNNVADAIGWFGETIRTTRPLPFKRLDMKLIFKEGTLTFDDLRWLLERVFRLQNGSETLRGPESRASSGPSEMVLDTLVQKVHLYLEGYELSALLDDVSDATADWHVCILKRIVPRFEEGLEAYEAYLRLCFDCVQRTYIDEPSYLR